MTIYRLPRFLRRLFRRRTQPLTSDVAVRKREKWAIAYAFVAWNGFGYMMYVFHKKNYNSDDGESLATLARGDVKVLHFKGMSQVTEKEIQDDETTSYGTDAAQKF